MSLQWMYENYPEGHEEMLLDNMRLLREGGYDWSYFFRKDVFPRQDLESLPREGSMFAFEHVVNLAQGIHGILLSALVMELRGQKLTYSFFFISCLNL